MPHLVNKIYICVMLEGNPVNDLLVPIMFAHAIMDDVSHDRDLGVNINDIEDLIVAIDKLFNLYGDDYVTRKTVKMLAKAQRFSAEIEEMLVAERFKPSGVSEERIRKALLSERRYIELRDKTLEIYETI